MRVAVESVQRAKVTSREVAQATSREWVKDWECSGSEGGSGPRACTCVLGGKRGVSALQRRVMRGGWRHAPVTVEALAGSKGESHGTQTEREREQDRARERAREGARPSLRGSASVRVGGVAAVCHALPLSVRRSCADDAHVRVQPACMLVPPVVQQCARRVHAAVTDDTMCQRVGAILRGVEARAARVSTRSCGERHRGVTLVNTTGRSE